MTKKPYIQSPIERFIAWMGSVQSLVAHTIFFLSAFGLSVFGFISWELMLLVLTTLVSLEAIYMAIFIQMTVNRNTQSLREVEEDIDEIQEDLDEIQEDVEEINEEDAEEEKREKEHQDQFEQIAKDMQRLLADIESLKKNK